MKSRIFVGSSSEGKAAAKTLIRALNARLGDSVDVRFWPTAFRLSHVTVEELERASREADFAALVLTADDALRIRGKKMTAPRDNITFEIGLFMGHLGRSRCYLVQEDAPHLRVPTDLLGVTTAMFQRPRDHRWRGVMASAAAKVAAAVQDLGTRLKLDERELKRQTDVVNFAKKIVGPWWERIIGKTPNRDWLTFFRMDLDTLHASVNIWPGQGYTTTGKVASRWESRQLIPRIGENHNTVHYHWEGYYLQKPTVRYHGKGEVTYEGDPSATQLDTGHGMFWDHNESGGPKHAPRLVELRRMSASEYRTMLKGPTPSKSKLVRDVLRNWR